MAPDPGGREQHGDAARAPGRACGHPVRAQHRRGAEVPCVKVDAIGIGSSVVDSYGRTYRPAKAEGKPVPFEVVAVVSSWAASEASR